MQSDFSSSYGRKRGLASLHSQQHDDSNIVKKARHMPEVAGKIICIELENFMCHSKLMLKFDVARYNCSYIVGPNGSGKSALFASLNIGLGGSGRSNERGKSIQSYIKEGKDFALIRIHLTNEGTNAIRDYQERIIVERRITEKTSGFVLKTRSANGGKEEVKAKKNTRHELELILQQFNIELDNPLAWLSQDRARQFLQSMKPDRLYQLYRKSSEVDSAENLFKSIDSHFEELTKIINTMDHEKNAKEQIYKEKKSRYDAIQLIREKKTEIQKLYWYKLWAPIRDWKNEIVEIQDKLEKNEKRKAEFLKALESNTKKIENINREQTRQEQARETAAAKCREHGENLLVHKRKIREIGIDLRNSEEEIRRKQLSMEALERELALANKKLGELMGSSNRDIDQEKQKLQEEQEINLANIERTQQEIRDISSELQLIETECQKQKRLHQAAEADHSHLERHLGKILNEKNIFEQSKANKLALYGPNVPDLVKAIDENKHRFKKKPIGPLGNYIKLRDKKWADPVEFAMKGILGIFICDSGDDRRELDKICNERQIKNQQITTTNFSNQKFNTNGQEPPEEFQTIARVIEAEEPTVYNYLLDKLRVDSVVLIEGEDEARNVMRENRPQNATKAYTLACSEVIPEMGRRAYTYFKGNGQFHSRVFADNFLTKDIRDFDKQRKQVEQEKQQKSSEVQELKATLRKMEASIGQLKQRRNQNEIKLRGLNERRYAIEDELNSLEQILLSSDQISNLRSSIQETKAEQQKAQGKLNEMLVKCAEKKERSNELESKLAAGEQRAAHLRNEHNQIENEIESCQIQIASTREKIEKINEVIVKTNDFVKKYREEIEGRKTKCDTQQQEAEKRRQQFMSQGATTAEVENGTPDFDDIPETKLLDRQIASIQREIKTEENNNDSPPTAAELQTYMEDYKKFKQKVKIWRGRYEKLELIINGRKKKFHMLKTSLPQKLECWFKDCMNMRSYKASLDVRDDDGTIDIKVGTHKAADEMTPSTSARIGNIGDGAKRIMQDLKGLSGGERSYTTACFIMALWKCMESPFRCLDEFDVFMDMVNRRIVMEMLADLAKENEDIQFFFFTPQPIQELKRETFEVFTLKKIEGIFDNAGQQNDRSDEEMGQ